MSLARRAFIGLAITAALTGCGLNVGQSTDGADAGRSAAVPTSPAETPAASGIPLSHHARAPAPPHFDRGRLSAAREDARAFFASYVAYLYGQLPVRRVLALSPRLRQQLDSDRADATPAERAARTRITRLSVATGHDPATVVAVATVRAGDEASELTATLRPSGSGWRIAAIAG
jgi:hypothetical protein